MEIQFYQTIRGDYPVRKFIKALPEKHRKKLSYRIELFKELGLQKSLQNGAVEKFKGKGNQYKGLYELIIDFHKIYYRIFFTMIKNNCWFMNAIKKKSNKAPLQSLSKAISIKKQLENKYQ